MVEIVNGPLSHTSCKLIVCPIACRRRCSLHPIPDVRAVAMAAYSHFRRRVDAKIPFEPGEILVSRFDDYHVCWAALQNAYNTLCKVSYIEIALQEIVKAKLHLEYDIAFPALGYYEEDRIDEDDVLELVQKYLGDSPNKVHFVRKY